MDDAHIIERDASSSGDPDEKRFAKMGAILSEPVNYERQKYQGGYQIDEADRPFTGDALLI